MPENDCTWYSRAVKKLFLDLHTPDHVAVGQEFDGPEFAAGVLAAGFQAVAVHAKCHYGNSYYYTDKGRRHPGLCRDLIAEAASACGRAGLGFMVYYSTGVDYHAGVAHPDWRVVDPAGAARVFQFRDVCLNSPYADELLAPQLRELAGGYDIEGLFLDMMTGFGPCYCPYCRLGFESDAGVGIPETDQSPHWGRYAGWRRQKAWEFFDKVGEAVHSLKPGLPIMGNGLFTSHLPLPPHPDFGSVTIDFTTAGPQALNADFETRYAAGLEVPADLFICWTLDGWADWSRRPADMVKQDLAPIVSGGARFFLGGRLHPDGRLDPWALELGRQVNEFLDPVIKALEGAGPVRDIAVLHSAASYLGPDLGFMGRGAELGERKLSVLGAHRLLCENGRHCTVVNEESLLRDLDHYGAVILPDQRHLSAELTVALKGFVERGGTLIASFLTGAGEPGAPEPDPGFFELLGLEFYGYDDLWYGYAKPPEELGGAEVLVYSMLGLVRVVDAEVLASWIYPYGMEHYRGPFGWGLAPPGGVIDYPAATIRRVGKGTAAYLAFDPFASYQKRINPRVRDLFLHILDRAYAEPAVRIVRGPSRVQAGLMAAEGRLFATLVSHHGERSVEGQAVADEVPPVRGIELEVRTGRTPKAVKEALTGRELEFNGSGPVTVIKLPELHIAACIEIEL